MLAPAAPAAASDLPIGRATAVIGGSPWPGRSVARITYFNASESKWPVKQAVRAWNSSGVRVRFAPAPRRRADVLIMDSGPRSDYGMSGFASVGYVYPGGGSVHLSRLQHPRRPNYSMAGVVTHELGHILGLEHEDDLCATMNTVLWASCSGDRPCRLLELDDIRGAVKLYGGRPRMVRPSFCPKPPSDIRATGDPRAYRVRLEWRNPTGPFFDRVQIARARGECPRKRPQNGSSSMGVVNGRFVDTDFASGGSLRTGRYCYALWSLGNPNVVSRRRTVWVDFHPSRPTAPTGLHAVLESGGQVALSWTQAAHPELVAVDGRGAKGHCPTSPTDGELAFFGTEGSADQVPLDGPGRYCFVAWARDTLGARFGPSSPVWVEDKGVAPVADFYDYENFLAADFYDQSYDQDGDAIVSRSWNFGDGTPVVTGNEANVSHTYAGAGTYTVRLTVTDANGLTGTTTHSVTVASPPPEGDPQSFGY